MSVVRDRRSACRTPPPTGAATPPGSATTRRRRARPATSVARCMTFDRCSTNGASGTFIDEQCGASASATERTAYSCSSRSLLERASDAASARSWSSSPVRRMVPASTREVTRPFSRRTSSSGVAPTSPSTANIQQSAVALGEPVQQPAHVERRPGRRVEVARQHHLVDVARRRSARPPRPRRRSHSAGEQRAVGERHVDRRARRGCRAIAGVPGTAGTAGAGSTPIVVSQPPPPRMPDDDLGHDAATPPAGESAANDERPEGDRPGAGQVDLVAHDGAARRGRSTTTPARRSGPARMPCGSPRGPSRRCPRRAAPTSTRRWPSPAGPARAAPRRARGRAARCGRREGRPECRSRSIGGSPAGSEVIAQQDTTRGPAPLTSMGGCRA